jgi:hypothetical protein
MIVAGLAVAWSWRPNPDPPLLRMEISAPEGVTFGAEGLTGANRPLALSPDGRALVFEAYSKDQARMFWVRLLNSDRTYPLVKIDGFFIPFGRPTATGWYFSAAANFKRSA